MDGFTVSIFVNYGSDVGYTHYWKQSRAFTSDEWALILGEARRIVAKAQRGMYYSGDEETAAESDHQSGGNDAREEFKEKGAWRSFPHPEQPIPRPGAPILLAAPTGRGKPRLNKYLIGLNGAQPHGYESFVLGKEPPRSRGREDEDSAFSGFCKTEYRPYDAVVVSILAVARTIAPDAIEVRSDGGDKAIRYLF